MELIRDLDETFERLNAKIKYKGKVDLNIKDQVKAKAKLVGRIYANDLNRIVELFGSKKERYENGLNECRGEMLNQLIHKRDEQLQQVDKFMQSSQQKNLSELKNLHKSIKQNYGAFAKGVPSVYESILFRSKLSKPFKLAQLVKYAKLMKNEKKINLAKTNHLFDDDPDIIHVLPSNLIFIYSIHMRNMLVLNRFDDLVHFKHFEEAFDYDAIRVNAINILAKSRRNQCVDVYNFKLELVHSIRLEQTFHYFEVNNFEIGLGNRALADELVIACYNFKTVRSKKKEICINTAKLKEELGVGMELGLFGLLDLNDRFLFISFDILCFYFQLSATLVFNREDDNKSFKCFKSDFFEWFMYNDQVCRRCLGPYRERLMFTFDLNSTCSGDTFTKIVDSEVRKFETLYSTASNKYIYSVRVSDDFGKVRLNHY